MTTERGRIALSRAGVRWSGTTMASVCLNIYSGINKYVRPLHPELPISRGLPRLFSASKA